MKPILFFLFILISAPLFSQEEPTDSLATPCMQPLHGVVINFKTGDIIPDAFVQIYDRDVLIDTVQAGKDALFSFNVACNKRFNVKAIAENFANNSSIVFSTLSQKDKVWQIKLFPNKEFKIRNSNKMLDVDNLLYMQDNIDFSKTDYKILDKVIGIMLKYPNIKVSINVHTDSNGLVAYNQTMTQDRADLVLNYLINNGIDSERLTAEGHGSSKLLNHCTPSVKCYEAEHRVNRRTEFIVF